MAKLPEPGSLEELQKLTPEIAEIKVGEEVSRIFFSDSEHPTAWDSFRYFGPTPCRFDHHLVDKNGDGFVQERGIMYLATGELAAQTCLAEVFQDKRTIDRQSRLPVYAGFALADNIRLLNLTGAFATAIGASTAIHSGPRARTRRWAQQLYLAYPKVDGILYCSSMNGNAPSIALFERAKRAIPSQNMLHRELRDNSMASVIAMTAQKINYVVV